MLLPQMEPMPPKVMLLMLCEANAALAADVAPLHNHRIQE
jgi:hypothetical protein